MYNLNYNVTNARLNRPVGRPFVPTARFDAFSGSLVLAIPGTIFKNGYVNVFNQVNEFDDISAYIVSGAVLDESTGQYFEQGPTQSLTLTGSYGSYSPSNSVNNFASVGYQTSLFFTGSIALKINGYSGSGYGVNLSSDKAFTIESWVAFPLTASWDILYPTSSNPIVVNAKPNRALAQKYKELTPESSSYAYYVGWTGDTDPRVQPPDFTLVSGASVFYIDTQISPTAYREEAFYPAYSSTWTPYEWKHYAVSYTPTSGSRYVRQYINGTLISEVAKSTNAMIFDPSIATLIFGDEGNFPDNIQSASQAAGAYYQDFRMYNGTNKNYTGSQFTPPQSMIIGFVEPYPQYNP